jgi:hypothetical protein
LIRTEQLGQKKSYTYFLFEFRKNYFGSKK